MKKENLTVTEFVLLGFPSAPELQFCLFVAFLILYFLTLAANLMIILIVRVEHCLSQSPMYFLLSHFSFLEIWYTTVTIPKMLSDFLSQSKTISHPGCVTQIYFFFSLGLTEFFLLAGMAFDRYLAICHPLRYTAIMTSSICNQLALWSWVGGFLIGLLLVMSASRLLFCGPNQINHFFCDFIPLLKLSCIETYIVDSFSFTVAWTVILISFILTTVSYFFIILAICRIPSTNGQCKAFSTCASHLAVVLTFYGTVIFMYIRPTALYNFEMEKVISLFYTVVTPLLNPLIYALRNREVKEALRRALKKHRVSF
ncbi:olfactory receptor 6-like [Rhinatrema bivittatum]|uniref:olfactory receptor 6-like n=1 Tax=Rhinatrema bivittatum TaxID=194408 RepID=UPI001127C049|nr:olfactory receptor 6-like [Rhinatrema bivittatum]